MSRQIFLAGALNRVKAELYTLQLLSKDLTGMEWSGYRAGLEDAMMKLDEEILNAERNAD
jgi:hypothetical protein